MAQCKKILEKGERCSNRAVPGTDYCQEHQDSRQRIKFRRVPVEPKLAQEEPSRRKARDEEPAAQTGWIAQPSATGEEPAFPGIRADDDRNILVAPESLIWLGAEEESKAEISGTLFDRLRRLLCYLSQEIPLPGQVTAQRISREAGILVRFTPLQRETADLSRLCDIAAAAATLSSGLIYIGEKRLFIQYRDGEAPRGYDAKDVRPPRGNALYLVDREGTHSISPRSMTEEPLDSVLLRISPLPARGVGLPDIAFALVSPPLYLMLARYFRNHHLNYRVSRFCATTDLGDLILFEITPRPDAPTGTFIPAFVISYLSDLPRCTVLTEVGTDTERRMLVEYSHQYPCLPRNIVEAFPWDSLLLFMTGPDFPNLCVSPSPTFFEGDELVTVQSPRPTETELKSVAGQEDLRIELPVRLAHDPGPAPSTAALIMDAKETEWIRHLVYRLPGEAFDAYMLCPGQEYTVLLGEGMAVESLPFGVPLKRVQDTQLFIPLRTRLVPDLPWKLLAQVLEIKEHAYTFLTPELRVDAPREAFSHLSRALVAESGRTRVALDVRPAPGLPPLPDWTPPPKPKGPAKRSSASQRRRDQKPDAAQEEVTHEPKDILSEEAESYRQAGDYLSAALCFALAGDNANAARCYQEAARRIKADEE